MSLEFIMHNADADDLVAFLTHEYKIESGIPVHLFSVVNAVNAVNCRHAGLRAA